MCREMTCPYHGPANRQKAATVETTLSNLIATSGGTVVWVNAGEQTAYYGLAFPSNRRREQFIGRLCIADRVEEAEWERQGDHGLTLTTPH